jgi:hypothetical protein
MENADGTFHILTHGQGRCRVKPSRSERVPTADGAASYLHYTEDLSYPLGRSDPNSERWRRGTRSRSSASTPSVFSPRARVNRSRRRCRTTYSFRRRLSARTCVWRPQARQALLEAPSLVDRFALAQRFMREQLSAQPSPETPR